MAHFCGAIPSAQHLRLAEDAAEQHPLCPGAAKAGPWGEGELQHRQSIGDAVCVHRLHAEGKGAVLKPITAHTAALTPPDGQVIIEVKLVITNAKGERGPVRWGQW